MGSPHPAKRRRVSDGGLITPISLSPPNGASEDAVLSGSLGSGSGSVLFRAVEVLQVEAKALQNIADIYQNDDAARDGLAAAVAAIVEAQRSSGKLIVCGVGKSGHIATKLVATAKSLGISASFLHASEAAHGDLGDVRERDVVLFVSFSGQTPELLNLLPHIPPAVRVMAMSSQRHWKDCQLLQARGAGILLPAPIHESEESTFGIKAPTTSTTVALAVSDMLALTVADELHRERTKDVFHANHPGGAIGMSHREVASLKESDVDISVVELPSPSVSAKSED